MRPRRDLRHHATERGMLLELRAHEIGANRTAAIAEARHHGRAGLVAARFYSQDPQFAFVSAHHAFIAALPGFCPIYRAIYSLQRSHPGNTGPTA
jgi:hypothetical protein